MDIVSNFILNSNHCNANGVFVKFRESNVSTAATPTGASLDELHLRLPPTICAILDRPLNAFQLCHWIFSHKETL